MAGWSACFGGRDEAYLQEIAVFADLVAGDEVAFRATTCRDILRSWDCSPLIDVRRHCTTTVPVIARQRSIGFSRVMGLQTSMDHADLNVLLQHSFRQRSAIRRNVRLPSEAGIRFCGDLTRINLFMSTAAVQANMQNDAAAFEGWSVMLIAWCGVKRIAIDWAEPTDFRNGHYQRFLYRLGHLRGFAGALTHSADLTVRLRRANLRGCAHDSMRLLVEPRRTEGDLRRLLRIATCHASMSSVRRSFLLRWMVGRCNKWRLGWMSVGRWFGAGCRSAQGPSADRRRK